MDGEMKKTVRGAWCMVLGAWCLMLGAGAAQAAGSQTKITGNATYRNATYSGQYDGSVFKIETDNAATVTFENVTFRNITAGADGSCVYIKHGKDKKLTVNFVNCRFIDCGTYGSKWGGAIYVGGSGETEVNFRNCAAVGCQANYGGFLYVDNAKASINGSAICSGCKAKTGGGGAYFWNVRGFGGFTFVGCEAGDTGGAIHSQCNTAGEGVVRDCRFYDNRTTASGGRGGAIWSKEVGEAIVNCTFHNNSATTGSDIYLDKPIAVDGLTFYEEERIAGASCSGGKTTVPTSELTLKPDGSGIYRITSAYDWDCFYYDMMNGRHDFFRSATVVLESDVATHRPVGGFSSDASKKKPFKGTFDGRGHTVTLVITGTGSDKGVFSCTNDGADIKDLKANGVIRGAYSLGGIVGNASNTTLLNCESRVSIVGTAAYAGGIVGYSANDVRMISCRNLGDVTAHDRAGGIAGLSDGGSRFLNCLNAGTVTAQGMAGGIVGVEAGPVVVENCHMFGSVANFRMDGKYVIYTKLDETKCLDIRSASTEAGAGLDLWTATKSGEKVFALEYDASCAAYIIRAEKSGLVLTAGNEPNQDWVSIYQDSEQDALKSRQRWTVEKSGSKGYCVIRSTANGWWMNVANNSTGDGASIIAYRYDFGGDNEKFKLVAEPSSAAFSVAGGIVGTGNANSTHIFCFFNKDGCVDNGCGIGVSHDALWGRATDTVGGEAFRMPDYVNDYIAANGKRKDGWLRVAFDRAELPTVVPDGQVDEFGYSVGRISDTEYIFWKLGKLYRVKNGVPTEIPYTLVTKDTGVMEGGNWYVVEGTVSRSMITVSGTANLVLPQGSSLMASGWEGTSGISVPAGNTLNIFGTVGGSLTAWCGTKGAGIGGGMGNAGGTVTIYGGSVTAEGGSGAGIGGGWRGAGGTVTICGGTVAATSTWGTDIGGGQYGEGGTLVLGPHVRKTGAHQWQECAAVTFDVPADLQLVSAKVDGGWSEMTESGASRTVLLTVGRSLTLSFAPCTQDFKYRVEGELTVTFGPFYRDAAIAADQLPAVETVMPLSAVGYALPNGATASATAFPICSTDQTMSMANGEWYVVTGEVMTAVIEVNGEVNLILADGAKLTVDGGIRVEGENKLNIFGQSAGTGELVANGAYWCAGIGGGNYGAGGTVTVNGGIVTATGGQDAAGIGGSAFSGNGGTLTVNGGIVTARGGQDAAGIGGGLIRAGGRVTINGGRVTALGNGGGKGIGGGAGAGGGSVAITGGTVDADGWNGQGLGGAIKLDGGSVKTRACSEQPKNSAGKRLYRVTVKCGGFGDQGSEIRVEGPEGYGTKDIYPIDGIIYLYLPDGEYVLRMKVGDVEKISPFAVMGDDVNVVLGRTGEFFINGEEYGAGTGDGWEVSDGWLRLTEKDKIYVLSGILDGTGVEVAADAEVVLSNATITTSGKPALSVPGKVYVNLLMSGCTSYLIATNAPAIEFGDTWNTSENMKIRRMPGADQFAEIVVASYGDHPAIFSDYEKYQAKAKIEVCGGNILVKSDKHAVAGCTFGISTDPNEPLLMKTGPSPDEVRFASSYNDEAFVGVVRSHTITVPKFAGVASVVVSNDIEQLKLEDWFYYHGMLTYLAMLTEEVTIDFTAVEGYEIVDNARIIIPCLTNDVKVGEGDVPAPNVRRKLTVTLPESLEGETYVVREDGEEVEKLGGGGESGVSVYPVRSGYDIEIVCTAEEGWRIVSETNVHTIAKIQESKVLSAADLPRSWRLFAVTVPDIENAYHDLNSDDEQMTAVGGSGANIYTIVSNAEVTVTFYAFGNYRIAADGSKTWALTGDVVFGETEGFPLPTLEGIPGTDAAPWSVGDNVQAYTNETGELTIAGTGAMDDFENAEDVPWNPSDVTAVKVDAGVTRIGANAFAGMADTVTIKGVPLSVYQKVSTAYVASEPIPDNMVLVSKTELETAGVETLTISDGKAYLGVSVRTNSDVTVEIKSWGKVNVEEKDVTVENGSVIIAVPANAEKGFMVLGSGDATK